MLLKLATCAIALALISQFIVIWRAGRRLAGSYDGIIVAHHRRGVWAMFWLTGAVIGLIEWQVRVSPNPYAVSHALFAFHLTIVGMLMLMFALIIGWFNGEKNPRWHASFAYAFFTLYALALASGTLLLYELP